MALATIATIATHATIARHTSLATISYHPLVHVKLGPLSISPHGVGIAVGFLLGARLMLPAAKRKGITEDDVYSLLTRAAIGAILGARLAYVVNHLGDYSSPMEALQVWKGGISLLGGFFGAILLALPEMRKRRLSFWKVMDAAAPGMALGVFVGRIGDLIVGDHLGKPTTFFLGYKCPPADIETAQRCVPGTIVHQTALYDLILVTVLLAGLLFLRRRRPDHYDGFLISVFGAWYGVQRIIEDFLREDTRHFGLTGSQITAILTVLLCMWHLSFVRRTPKWGRWDELPTMAEPGAQHDEPDENQDDDQAVDDWAVGDPAAVEEAASAEREE
ncbi:MAG: phosphatidylglycerol---prolipoprotein diacylglyceryl transferase [Acidimicrobiaceae bacterium]|nr:phosphatidylglycerol---prolipoprotein diacylglyceryl transferase [Acidimicrobiaceae bacterium]